MTKFLTLWIKAKRMITTGVVKEKIIKSLNLEDLSPNEIDDNDALFNEGLGLDSVDAIELIVILDNEFGVKFENMNEVKNVFATIQSLTNYINEHAK
jgi:acyl carrier protein